MSSETIGEELSDKLTDAVEPLVDQVRERPEGMPGPSTNPATNLLIADIALRGVGRVVRNSIQKGMLRAGYDRDKANDLINNRTLLSSLLLYGASKVATRSIPGAMLVGSGLLAKTLYDRGLSRSKAKRDGDKQLERMADEK